MQTSLINWYLLTQLSKKINGTFSAQSTYQATKDMLVGHHSILQALAVTIFKHLSKPISKLPQNFKTLSQSHKKSCFLNNHSCHVQQNKATKHGLNGFSDVSFCSLHFFGLGSGISQQLGIDKVLVGTVPRLTHCYCKVLKGEPFFEGR